MQPFNFKSLYVHLKPFACVFNNHLPLFHLFIYSLHYVWAYLYNFTQLVHNLTHCSNLKLYSSAHLLRAVLSCALLSSFATPPIFGMISKFKFCTLLIFFEIICTQFSPIECCRNYSGKTDLFSNPGKVKDVENSNKWSQTISYFTTLLLAPKILLF